MSSRNRRRSSPQAEQHVLGQVLAQEPAARLGAAQDPPPLVGGPAARGQVEQLQARGPALRSAGEDGQVARQDRVVVDVAEQLLDLPRPEPQVVRPELEEVVGDAQARQVDRRRDPAGDDDREPWRRVVHEPPERRLGRRALQRVAVVDDERRRGRGPRSPGPSRRPRPWTSRRGGRAAPTGAPPRGGGRTRPRPRPRSPPGTSPRGPRPGRRSARRAWSCRSPPGPRRASAGGARRRRGAPRAARGAARPATGPGSSPARPEARPRGHAAALPEPDVARHAIAALHPRPPSEGSGYGAPGARRGPPRWTRGGRSDGPVTCSTTASSPSRPPGRA